MENTQVQTTSENLHIPVKKKKKKWYAFFKSKAFIIPVVILIIAGVTADYIFKPFAAKVVAAEYEEYIVQKGDISLEISATGSIEANDQYEIIPLVNGDILSDTFQEGDIVKKDQLLYDVDPKDFQKSLDRQNNAIERSRISYQDLLDSVDKLNVKSTDNGVVTNVYVKIGDNVQNGGKIADFINDSSMVLTIPFNEDDAKAMRVGESANVTLENNDFELSGKVSKVASGVLTATGYARVTMVEIIVKNVGSIEKGDTATALVGNFACNSSGEFDYIAYGTITAETSGTVKTLNISNSDKVTNGQIVAKLESTNLDNQIKTSKLSLDDAQSSLDTLMTQLNDYKITSPIEGTVISKTSKAGDTIGSSKQTVMALIADLTKMKFTINIDELDIGKIKKGQKVAVTADALTGREYEGYVDNIGNVGTAVSGVTTYAVKVIIDKPEGLMVGMNVNANIVIDSRQNVLKIPSSAITRGNYIMIKMANGEVAPAENTPTTGGKNRVNQNTSTTSGKNNAPSGNTPATGGKNNSPGKNTATTGGKNNSPGKNTATTGGKNNVPMPSKQLPDGAKYQKITTGINDTEFIEVTEGLKEGDVIFVPSIKVAAATSIFQGMPSGPPSAAQMTGGGNRAGGGNYGGGGNRTAD